MIDLHCHILAAIDDGPEDISQSVEMARIARADGITTIVATPHVKNTILPATVIREKVATFNSRLAQENIPLAILPGADVYALLSPSLFSGLTINDTPYILIEFPHSHLPRNAHEILFKMIAQGYRPIITHPERNGSVLQNPALLFGLLEIPALVQITADSLCGNFGPGIQACAIHLLERNAVHFIATDAHSPHFRRPILSAALKTATKIIGREKAMRLVVDHPQAVINGDMLWP